MSNKLKYKDYEYVPWEDREPDVIKIFHDVITPEGEEVYADFSPYRLLSQKAFETWIDRGMPNRGDAVGPLKIEDFT